MSTNDDHYCYRGIPIRMSIAAGAQWETYAPTPGPISLATTIYEEYDEYSGCMSADYDTKQTFAKLRKLASSGEYFKKAGRRCAGYF